MKATNRQLARKTLDDIARPVGRVVIDHDDLAVERVLRKASR